jgi:hypothetical protein
VEEVSVRDLSDDDLADLARSTKDALRQYNEEIVRRSQFVSSLEQKLINGALETASAIRNRHAVGLTDADRIESLVNAYRFALRSVRHNHVTRDIKPKGVCPACDAYHQKQDQN